MSDLKQELCNFEGSDALGVGDFSVCLRAAARIAELEAALRKITEKSKHAHLMSYEADYYRIAIMALKGEKDDNDNH